MLFLGCKVLGRADIDWHPSNPTIPTDLSFEGLKGGRMIAAKESA